MHYLGSRNIHFYTTYHISVYEITHKTLVHTKPGITTESEKGEYNTPKKGMELENNFSLKPSSINPER